MPKFVNKTTINLCTLLGLIACGVFIVYGFQRQIFTSQDALRSFVSCPPARLSPAAWRCPRTPITATSPQITP